MYKNNDEVTFYTMSVYSVANLGKTECEVHVSSSIPLVFLSTC